MRKGPASSLAGRAYWAVCPECNWRSGNPRWTRKSADEDRDAHNNVVHEDD